MISWAGDEEEVMELLWQNGQVVMKSQRSPWKPPPFPDDRPHPLDLIHAAAIRGGSPPHYNHHHHDPSLQQQNDADNNNLFIQEDEMSTWLLSDFCSDLLHPATPAAISAVPSRPPPAVPPPKRLGSFGHFSRLNHPRATPADEATVVDSSDTPMIGGTSDNAARAGMQSTLAVVGVVTTHDRIATSSSGASSASAEPIPSAKSQEVSPSKTEEDPPDLRKRKARDGNRSINGEDVELLSSNVKRVLRSSSSTKRSRAAEVHNISERKRRDRINEKMRALQELIPHCNKADLLNPFSTFTDALSSSKMLQADKASMLDEAIGYLKSLQMQLQMMSTGCSMMPMMYPGMQQYMPHKGMGMNRQIHFPNGCNCSTLPTTATGPHMGPGFCFPAFQIPSHIPAPDLSRMPPTNQADAMLSSSSLHRSNSPRMLGFMDPYQQYFGLQHMHLPFQQSQANKSNMGKPTTSKAEGTSRKGSPD